MPAKPPTVLSIMPHTPKGFPWSIMLPTHPPSKPPKAMPIYISVFVLMALIVIQKQARMGLLNKHGEMTSRWNGKTKKRTPKATNTAYVLVAFRQVLLDEVQLRGRRGAEECLPSAKREAYDRKRNCDRQRCQSNEPVSDTGGSWFCRFGPDVYVNFVVEVVSGPSHGLEVVHGFLSVFPDRETGQLDGAEDQRDFTSAHIELFEDPVDCRDEPRRAVFLRQFAELSCSSQVDDYLIEVIVVYPGIVDPRS